MPGSKASMAVQETHRDTPPSQGPRSTRSTESQKKRNGYERAGDIVGSIKPKKSVCPVNKVAQMCNTVANGPNIAERLKAARERREEQEKLLASREQSRLEREERARRYHEQQLQERKDKFQNQRLKEERKRAAVEENRKYQLKEEKERYESAVRKAEEKSQRVQQSLIRNSRGRKPTKSTPRRLPLTSWERNLVIRLLTPTCSYLARSKSAVCQSGEEVVHICRRAVSFHSMTPTITVPHKPQQKPPTHMPSAPPRPSNSQHRSPNTAQIKVARQQSANEKNNSNARSPAAIKTAVKPARVKQGPTTSPTTSRTTSPTTSRTTSRMTSPTTSRTTSPSPERNRRRSVPRRLSTPLVLELPSVPEEDVAYCSPALSPGNARPDKGQREKTRDENPPAPPRPEGHEVVRRPSAGTTDLGEASRLLAEKRREARLQREEEEERGRLQREEAERRSREELEGKRAEERARQRAEAQRLVEEKRKREEKEQRKAEEERAEAAREAALLQKQREEEQAKERAKAEQLNQEREALAQKEEAARQVRRKRLEEIMRRTRRTDPPVTKASILPNVVQPKENTEPVNKLPKTGVKLEVNNEEDVAVPVVAFKERRSLRTLTGLEEIQSHQRAEVI
ncbi:ensconsin-like isoform X2 [Pseudoliparis swirei]|uniref:ensconsin-like isoform X2 n=1 Tax=Pseudoliparis swirei TaxID=2059687 RepID=UPI0024BE800D|nr:ensconsin-like isoform X2 [Pseudoliparis swirei]